MTNRDFILTALEPLPKGEWVKVAGAAMKHLGWNAVEHKSRVLAWKEVSYQRGVRFADGWSLIRLWLGPSRWALCLCPKRLYFQDGNELDYRSEHEIVGPARPNADIGLQVEHGHVLCTRLASSGLLGRCKPVAVRPLDCDLASSRVIRIGAHVLRWNSGTLNSYYRQHGFETVPERMVVSICPVEGISRKCAESVATLWTNATRARGIAATFRLSTVTEVRSRLRDLVACSGVPSAGHCILFILNSRNTPVSTDLLQLLDDLDSLRVPYRRAFANDPFEYSIPDQLPSVLHACGGVAHRVDMKSIRPRLWSIGVDLSHREDGSVLALTLLDSLGVLRGGWTTRQKRDETARPETLRRVLERCRDRMIELGGGQTLLVLRDGRMFENEDVRLYESTLRRPVSLLEYRKRGNPLVLACSDIPEPARSPSAFCVQGLSTLFIGTTAPRTSSDLPRIAKVSWKDEWNELALSSGEIAEALTLLSSAPGLGMHAHHLPAPLYWADGIAGATAADLRFRGQMVERVADQ